MDEFTKLIEEEVRKQEPHMWAIAKNFLDRGYPREEVLNQLENIRARFRELDLELEEDRVMDLMDCFYGWCLPEWRL